MHSYISYILLFLLWLLYYAVHSILAMHSVKEWLSSKSELFKRHYRLVYSVFSILLILPLLGFMVLLPKVEVIKGVAFFRPLSYIFLTSGVIFIRRAFKAHGLKSFLGLEKMDRNEELIRKGILGRVRHPLYTGAILICLSFFLFTLSASAVAMVLATFFYLPIGIWLEEKKLILTFGQDYLDYKKEVPALVPRKWF